MKCDYSEIRGTTCHREAALNIEHHPNRSVNVCLVCAGKMAACHKSDHWICTAIRHDPPVPKIVELDEPTTSEAGCAIGLILMVVIVGLATCFAFGW